MVNPLSSPDSNIQGIGDTFRRDYSTSLNDCLRVDIVLGRGLILNVMNSTYKNIFNQKLLI